MKNEKRETRNKKREVRSKMFLILGIVLMLFATTANAQIPIKGSASTYDKYTAQSYGDSVASMVYLLASNANLGINIASSLTNGTKSVTTTASALASSTPAKHVWIQNESGATIYFGGAGITTSTGLELHSGTGVIIDIDDPSKIYVVASSTVTIRYMIMN